VNPIHRSRWPPRSGRTRVTARPRHQLRAGRVGDQWVGDGGISSGPQAFGSLRSGGWDGRRRIPGGDGIDDSDGPYCGDPGRRDRSSRRTRTSRTRQEGPKPLLSGVHPDGRGAQGSVTVSDPPVTASSLSPWALEAGARSVAVGLQLQGRLAAEGRVGVGLGPAHRSPGTGDLGDGAGLLGLSDDRGAAGERARRRAARELEPGGRELRLSVSPVTVVLADAVAVAALPLDRPSNSAVLPVRRAVQVASGLLPGWEGSVTRVSFLIPGDGCLFVPSARCPCRWPSPWPTRSSARETRTWWWGRRPRPAPNRSARRSVVLQRGRQLRRVGRGAAGAAAGPATMTSWPPPQVRRHDDDPAGDQPGSQRRFEKPS